MTAPHLRAGQDAEHIASRWLRRRGLKQIANNYRCKAGEIDLVMLDGDCLVIVEVRYRRSHGYGGALNSVSAKKQQRIAAATMSYLQTYRQFKHHALRFDILALTGNLNKPAIEWHQRAFNAEDLGLEN